MYEVHASLIFRYDDATKTLRHSLVPKSQVFEPTSRFQRQFQSHAWHVNLEGISAGCREDPSWGIKASQSLHRASFLLMLPWL